MMEENKDIGTTTGTVNPVVFECNDSYLNDIRGMHITEEHASAAVKSASADFEEGSVGAGAGMSCYKLKGGIGTASRIIKIDGKNIQSECLFLQIWGFLMNLLYQVTVLEKKLKSLENLQIIRIQTMKGIKVL